MLKNSAIMTHLQIPPFYYLQPFNPGVHSLTTTTRNKLQILQTSSFPFRYGFEFEEAELMECESGKTTISHLYPEILTIIFSKLDLQSKGRVAQVCTAWRDAVYAKSCWKGIEAKFHLRKGSQALFSSLIKRGIRRVHILSIKRPLKDVVVALPNLESLNLSGTYNVVDIGIAIAFSTPYPNLRVLDMSLCKQITDASLGRVAESLKNLQTLELSGCYNITNTGLLLIAWGLKHLKRLNLRSCWQISDQGIGHLAGLSKDTAQGNAGLEYLGLQDCQNLTDEALKFIADGLPSLKCINLSFCGSITDHGVKHFSNKMPHLEELSLSACDNITDMAIAYLSEGVNTLQTLDLSFCDKISDTAMGHIAQGLYHLKSINLSACHVTDLGLEKVIRAIHEIEVLNIGQCAAITDNSVQLMSEELHNLRAIDIYGCTKISKQSIQLILKLPKIEVVNEGLWHKR